MPIPLKLGSNGNLNRFAPGDALLIDQIEKLSGTGNIVIGSLLGVGQEVQLGSAAGDTHVLGNLIVDGSLVLGSDYDLLLTVDPPNPSTIMTTTYVRAQLTQEQWRRAADNTLIKQIDYTYTGQLLTTEVRKVYAADGITIMAQLTLVYTYSHRRLTSVTSTHAGTSTGSSYDLLLASDPASPSTTMALTYTNGKISQEQWRRASDNTLLKQIDYTYSRRFLMSEVRKIYASNGTTVVAQLTLVYTYTGNSLTSATSTRNI